MNQDAINKLLNSPHVINVDELYENYANQGERFWAFRNSQDSSLPGNVPVADNVCQFLS